MLSLIMKKKYRYKFWFSCIFLCRNLEKMPKKSKKRARELAQSVEELVQSIISECDQLATDECFYAQEQAILNDMLVKRCLYLDQETGLYLSRADANEKTKIFWFRDRVSIDEARDICQQCRAEHLTGGVFVLREGLTSQARLTMASGLKWSQFFALEELSHDILSHELIQKHELIPEAERPALLKRLRCTMDQLPTISCEDAVVKFNGWKIGEIIKIKRCWGAGTEPSFYYRLITSS